MFSFNTSILISLTWAYELRMFENNLALLLLFSQESPYSQYWGGFVLVTFVFTRTKYQLKEGQGCSLLQQEGMVAEE